MGWIEIYTRIYSQKSTFNNLTSVYTI